MKRNTSLLAASIFPTPHKTTNCSFNPAPPTFHTYGLFQFPCFHHYSKYKLTPHIKLRGEFVLEDGPKTQEKRQEECVQLS